MVTSTVLTEAIGEYNEYRSPMATATLLETNGDRFSIRFEGPFCRMCCDYDYFEDFIYELQTIGHGVESLDIADITYEGDETFLVEYSTRT